MSFITDFSKFEVLQERASKVFGAQPRGLPHRTFTSAFGNFKFIDFDETLTRKFWPALDWLVEQNGDVDLTLLMHDPDPVSYYRAHFGRYGALCFERGSTSEDYYRALHAVPDDSPADAIFHVAATVSWFGSSGAWGIWGDRNIGVAVVGTRRPPSVWASVEGLHWMDVDQALADVVSLNFKNQVVPPEVMRELRASYSGLRAK